MERLPNRYPKISQSHKVPLYKGLSLFYPKLQKNLNAYILSLKILLTLCLQYENRHNNGITRDACRLCA